MKGRKRSQIRDKTKLDAMTTLSRNFSFCRFVIKESRKSYGYACSVQFDRERGKRSRFECKTEKIRPAPTISRITKPIPDPVLVLLQILDQFRVVDTWVCSEASQTSRNSR
jgi:hypothetical protein